jgi:3-hydroxyisobutyrate dehydrogenase
MSDQTTYGYIGLGQMGAAMASRLLSQGMAVVVYDLDPDPVAAAVAAGATAASSPAEVAAASDVVSICVPAASHIHAVLAGPGGIAEAGRSGQTLLIHSTVAPQTIFDARDTAAQWGGVVHDACVAGGGEAASAGELVILAGGLNAMDPQAVAVLNVYGSKVIDGGEVGTGAALKLGVNIMTYAQFAAAASAFELAGATGADPAGMVEAWRHTGQLGRLTESFLGLLSIPAEHVTGGFREYLETTVGIATKDLDLAAGTLATDSARRGVVEALSTVMPDVFGVATTP